MLRVLCVLERDNRVMHVKINARLYMYSNLTGGVTVSIMRERGSACNDTCRNFHEKVQQAVQDECERVHVQVQHARVQVQHARSLPWFYTPRVFNSACVSRSSSRRTRTPSAASITCSLAMASLSSRMLRPSAAAPACNDEPASWCSLY